MADDRALFLQRSAGRDVQFDFHGGHVHRSKERTHNGRCYGDARVRERGPPGPIAGGSPVPMWLSDDEFRTLCAACDRLIPADETAGAVEAGVPEYIDG